MEENCWCDPSFAGIAYIANANDNACPSYTTACWVHYLITDIAFFVMGIYITTCLIYSLWMSLKIKWIRYFILLFDVKSLNNQSLLIFLDFLYPAAISFGMMAYVILVYVWMKFYREIIEEPKSGCFSKTSGKIFLLSNLVATILLTLVFILESAIPSSNKEILITQLGINHTVSSIWIVIQILPQSVTLSIYGRRISKTIQDFSAASPSDLDKFKRLHWFTTIASIWFAISILILIAGAVLVYITTSLVGFLAKHAGYRICELILAFIIVKSLQPRFRRREMTSSEENSSRRMKTVNLPSLEEKDATHIAMESS